jgi:hypothetical protein
MSHTNAQLAAFKARSVEAGHASLAAVAPGDALGGQPRLVMLYLQAVLGFATSHLMERYRSFDAAGGNQRMQDQEPSIDEERRNAHWAVRDILGQPHITAELI